MLQLRVDDITGMKSPRLIVLFLSLLCHGQASAPLGAQLSQPRVLDDDNGSQFSVTEFERQLQKMKAEREALRTDWQTLVKKNARPAPSDADLEMQTHLKTILQLLQQRHHGSSPPLPPQVKPLPPADTEKKPLEPQPSHVGHEHKTAAADTPVEKVPAAQKMSAQANALYRSKQFEDALAALRLIELKGQKAEVRAPVQYLMAMCLLHLGKNDEALPLLREVANTRGDEKLAGYAQWQLEMLRWQRDIQDRLQNFRQRRETLEKRL
jgi:TolA-binding protein